MEKKELILAKTRLAQACRAASLVLLVSATAVAEPMREWDWHMPPEVYKELDFTDRANVDRAVKLFERAVGAERGGRRVTDLVPMYRAAAGEWRKVQVQAETAGGNESLLAYATFMQGYAKQQAHDRNEAIKIFNEVVDLYPDQKFISVPARYMLYVVKRELGDLKKAEADLEEIVEDRAADGHKIYYNVLRSLGALRWGQDRTQEAAEIWEKIVYSKGKPDGTIWGEARHSLMVARLVNLDFPNLEAVVLAGLEKASRDRRVQAIAANARWVSEIDRVHYNEVTHYLDRKYPREKKASARRSALEKIFKGYAEWLENESGVFDGYDDGWTFATVQFQVYSRIEKVDRMLKRLKELETIMKAGKPDLLTARARQLAMSLCALNQPDAARNIAAIVKDTFARLRLQYDVENHFAQYKAAAMYLEEYINVKPAAPPEAVRAAKYDLAWLYRQRLHASDKAVKIYQELDDPPRSLWALSEAFREIGKKKESYSTLTEIASIFPNDAASAVLRMAQWREADGEKEKAIALYRRLMNHPKWKETGASSQAHQALERLGIATGGAMVNEVR